MTFLGKLYDASEDGTEPFGMVGVGVAMDGGKDIRIVSQLQTLYDVGLLLGDGGKMQAVVVHDVAAVVDLRVVDGIRPVVAHGEAFSFKVFDAGQSGGEEQCGAVVAHDAVDLLGHGLVERAQPRLDVDDRDVDLGGGHGTGEGGVGVAIEHDIVGLLLE